ncbi:glycosyltransferase family 4 protein [Kiritimatiella glycovorans]|uniref:Capsular glucan synthase n=1 Tax=Kiritimatiella glycovorans TaxID=1307763 RepID=A0A0G3EFC5_9BACT|nr:glycosyltransferase family 4 protein [Kiritimatiella glycovorans]AKJ65038.1 Capsular glucan synthase [Kiritimatiella glycovorans]
MKIAVLNWRCFRHPQAGGSEVYLHEQAKRWAAQGHSVDWLAARVRGAPAEEVHDGISFRRVGGKYTIYMKAQAALRRLRPRPEVVIDVENGIPFFSPLYVSCPVVLLVHHVHTEVWRRELTPPLALLGRFLESRVMPKVYRGRPIVTVSPSSAEMIRGLFGAQTAVEVIYNAFSGDLTPGDKAQRPEIVYLGRLKRYKSVDVLLDAVRLLHAPEVLFRLIGHGDDEPRLRGICREYGISDRVRFEGRVSEEDKRRFLQRAWIAVNPSMMEGWSITNLEANACGTPVLGSDVPGIRDSIRPGVNGDVFPYGAADVLADKIRGLLDDPDRRAAWSESSLAWAAEFSWDRSADKWLSLLQKVCRKEP